MLAGLAQEFGFSRHMIRVAQARLWNAACRSLLSGPAQVRLCNRDFPVTRYLAPALGESDLG
ncbi:hypothetical protein SAMN04488238_11119 [Roseicitreum antarcticum]|uniref:Uncharacterized protein n=2 Tax=Roseicitreum antarcticum TaxID=564137 RepID=A0A1H3CY65_9RHOB|nr:hypothetical protein SAMN04488238_11119 [Roseicitreum antarcticum]